MCTRLSSKWQSCCLLGLENGALRLHLLEYRTSSDLSALGASLSLGMHDSGGLGVVTRALVSYDGAFVVSVGADSNLFVYRLNDIPEAPVERPALVAKLPSAKRDGWRAGDDIDDPNAYSIEEAKQKDEHDEMVRVAEERKGGVRQNIARLRQQFKRLLQQNEERLPEHLRLDRREFELDPAFRAAAQRALEEKVSLAERELAWSSEKHERALNKLFDRCVRALLPAFYSVHVLYEYLLHPQPVQYMNIRRVCVRACAGTRMWCSTRCSCCARSAASTR